MFPENFAVLIVGDPSAGMFEFCCYLGASYLRTGEKLVFVELNSPPDQVVRQLEQFGIDSYEHMSSGTFALVDGYSSPEVGVIEPGIIKVRDTANLEELIERVTEGIVKVGGAPVKVLVDSVTPLYMDHEDRIVAKFFSALNSMVKVSGTISSVVHGGILKDEQINMLSSMADGLLEMKVDEGFRRYVRIKHFRGIQVSSKWVPFDFEFKEDVSGASVLSWRREKPRVDRRDEL